ncbi:MAG: hypothetical protein Q4A00_08530 [Flavobacteriaceae bacterium]|nr:hypothetical protein [Flavobacteriaceae bacterium]
MKKNLLLIPLVLLLLLPLKVEAKGFGVETETTETHIGAGQCMLRTTKKFKLFWLTVYKHTEVNIYAC